MTSVQSHSFMKKSYTCILRHGLSHICTYIKFLCCAHCNKPAQFIFIFFSFFNNFRLFNSQASVSFSYIRLIVSDSHCMNVSSNFINCPIFVRLIPVESVSMRAGRRRLLEAKVSGSRNSAIFSTSEWKCVERKKNPNI